MLQRVFRRLGHHTRCLWILDGLRFGRHCRAIDAEGARARIARSDRIERRDILEPLHLLRKLIEPGGLLRKLLHFLCSERFTGARSCDGIAVDRAVCRIWWGRRQGSGRCGAREGGVDSDRVCDGRRGREGRLGTRAEERGRQAWAVRRVRWGRSRGAHSSGELVERGKTTCRRGSLWF